MRGLGLQASRQLRCHSSCKGAPFVASCGPRGSVIFESTVLPHHKLIAFGVAKELLFAVRDAHVRDAKLRDEALRSTKSACLNCAEGAGRVTRADKARASQSHEPKRSKLPPP